MFFWAYRFLSDSMIQWHPKPPYGGRKGTGKENNFTMHLGNICVSCEDLFLKFL